MTKRIRLNCMRCGKEIKLDFNSIKTVCKKCQKITEKPYIYDPYFIEER